MVRQSIAPEVERLKGEGVVANKVFEKSAAYQAYKKAMLESGEILKQSPAWQAHQEVAASVTKALKEILARGKTPSA